MRGYRIVQKGDKWHFELMPNNNNGQAVGLSKQYSSYSICIEAVKQLRELIITNKIDTISSQFVRLEQSEKGMCVIYQIDGDGVFQTRHYTSSYPKQSCRESVAAIYRYIDEYTLKQII